LFPEDMQHAISDKSNQMGKGGARDFATGQFGAILQQGVLQRVFYLAWVQSVARHDPVGEVRPNRAIQLGPHGIVVGLPADRCKENVPGWLGKRSQGVFLEISSPGVPA
jgi:hypothetical protein